jgi:hypothetical protein
MPAYSTDKGFTGSGSAYGGGGLGKSTSSGSSAGLKKSTQPRDPAGPKGAISGGSGVGPGAKSYNGRKGGDAGAGTKALTEPKQNRPLGFVPLDKPKPRGATDWYGSASPGQFVGAVVAAAPGGLLNEAPDAVQGLTSGKFKQQYDGGVIGRGVDSLLGTKPGVQTGWSEDPSMTPGRDRSQRGTQRESFDQTTLGTVTRTAGAAGETEVAPAPTDRYSDIALLDRRKPYTSLKQMLETML